VELSSFYLDVLKDRLYCSGKKSLLRRSAQTALFELMKTSLLWMAPILPFTSEEAWETMPDFKDKLESVHLGMFPDLEVKWLDAELFTEWEELVAIREHVLKELESARENKMIGNSLEARIVLKAPEDKEALLRKYEPDLPSLFIVSDVELTAHPENEFRVEVERASGEKCIRCWNYSASVGESRAHPSICHRCLVALGEGEKR